MESLDQKEQGMKLFAFGWLHCLGSKAGFQTQGWGPGDGLQHLWGALKTAAFWYSARGGHPSMAADEK